MLALMAGSVRALSSREAANKQSAIVISQKPSQPSTITEVPKAPKQSEATTTATPTPLPQTAVTPTSATTVASSPTPVAQPTPSPTPTPAPTPAPTPSPTPPPPAPTPTYVYKDGTYSAVGTFTAPGVTNHLNVSITISKDVVTSSTVTVPAGTDPTSKNYDNNFIANYKPYVTGKPLANLNLSKIAAASLTPNGFNDALAQIRVTAHS
jgi:hypothetical protein